MSSGTGNQAGLVEAPSRFGERVQAHFGPYLGEVCLNVGCGYTKESGFINVDRVAGVADLVVDLDDHPNLARGSTVDCILASHVLEHITHLIPLMREFHRVLKPGGHLIACTPYASSDSAVEDPTHVRSFTERSWKYFDRRLYETPNHAGHYPSPVDFCFDVVEVRLIPYPEIEVAAVDAARHGHLNMLDVWKRQNRNVIREVIAVLRKVEG